MKKLILLLLVIVSTFTIEAQSIWKPVPKDLFSAELSADRTVKGNSVLLPRWTAGISAEKLNYNKVTKKLEPESFSKIGIGFSLANYIDVNGEPYNNWSVNAFLFLPTLNTDNIISLAVTVSALQYLQIGFDFEPGKWNSDYFPVSPLLGLKYTF